MGNEDHRKLGKTLTTTRVDELELILYLTVKTWGPIYFAAISKISHNIKICKKKNNNNNIKLQNQYNLLFWKTRRPRTARVVARTFPLYDRMCCAFLKSHCKFYSLKPFSWIKTWVSKLTSLLFVSLSESILCRSFKSIIASIFKLSA